ncbi:hypothetical protein [Microcoleus sp. FACHB-831]|uniref:hypothetical protein n=1 Tax=Microcoleus sp. FACHB-831 TaxID=2692827 RepID=UPI001F5552DC|nr:hypothetical protein [Microcoleus sp. FACHB-831]
MFEFLLQLIRWLRGGTLRLLVLALIILMVWGITSPVGTMVWWLNQGAEGLGLKKHRHLSLPATNNSTLVGKSSNINCYIIYLPGVGDFSGDELTEGEAYFLDRLVQSHPNCVAVGDVFPYSAANKSLGGERLFAPVWRWGRESKGWQTVTDLLLKIRNLWRFAISADPRYGTIYNQGIANAIIDRMNAQHPIPQSPDKPIKIILAGTSGGIEVALGAAPYLKELVDANIIIVSAGGVFNGRNGFNKLDSFYHLRGRRDWVEDIGAVVFPTRWLVNVGSEFNQARLQGRYTARTIGPQTHDGPQGYFGQDIDREKGVSYVDLTLQDINKLPIWEGKEIPHRRRKQGDIAPTKKGAEIQKSLK